MLNDKVQGIIQDSISVKKDLLEDHSLIETIIKIANKISDAFKNGNALYICGNGGSSSDADHIAAELSGRFYKDRLALKCQSLHSNGAYLTAVANDYGYENIYSRLVEGWMNEGDILIGLSTSGNSLNVYNAFMAASSRKVFTIALLGNNSGKLGEIADECVNIPSSLTPRIQEAHILVGHILCELIEEAIF